MTASTRRAALGAILAAPLASVPALAATGSDEARFLADAPRLVALLDEYDRLWEASRPFYFAYSERSKEIRWDHDQTKELPEWHAYLASREGADEIDAELCAIYESFNGIRFHSAEAIMVRQRYAMTFDWAEDEAAADVRAYWEARKCA